MAGVNKAIILGNLGRDPETRYSKDGKPITNFSVATSQKRGDQEYTEWHNVVCFGRVAEVAAEYLRKGSKVYVEGMLKTSNWEKDGQKHYRTEIMANQLQMLGEVSSPDKKQATDCHKPEMGGDDFDDQDIPF